MSEIQEHLRAEMRYTQNRQETNANQHRLPTLQYKVGDDVCLNAKNIQTTHSSRKLDWKRLGRFKVKTVISLYA
jgi:hypothetical protein